MEVILSSIQLSDIFFNLEKPKLAAAYVLKAETDEEMEEREQAAADALLEEAENFSALLNGQVSADWLVSDYQRRV